MDTPDKRVEEWKNELRNITDPSGITFIDKFGQNEVVAIERFIENTLTQYHQDLMNEVVEKLEKERKPLIHDVNWAEGYNAGLTKAQTIIKSLTPSHQDWM